MVKKLELRERAAPVRRVWIPKPGKNELRGLGIPALQDRALQTLVKLGMEPEWEARFEANSYGFRPGSSAWDAMAAIYNGIIFKPKWVLDTDIEKCYDRNDFLLVGQYRSPRDGGSNRHPVKEFRYRRQG
jgi:RNA-directed DNA polymerase